MNRFAISALLLLACNGKSEPDEGDETGPSALGPAGSEVLPADASIGKISLYQGVEYVLTADGEPGAGARAPVVVGREAVVRAFVRPATGYSARELTGVLTVRSEGAEDVVLTDTRRIRDLSADAEMDSTLNFHLPADLVTASTELRFELREVEGGPGGGDPALTTWDSSTGGPDGLVTVSTDDLTVVIVPVQYDGDGSGRLPDTSQAQLDALRDAMYRVYPARSVTVRVAEPLPWAEEMSPFNPLGWTRLLDAVSSLRGEADELPNTYYYGMFAPSDTFDEFCGGGCIAGLSEFGFNTTNPSLRTSIGVGFVEVAADTMVHELGHAHGRFHADCGGAAGTDPNYPYPDALIGSWGLDLLTDSPKDPTEHTDIMGYCYPQWVSNYTYFALGERIGELGAQTGARSAMQRVTKLRVDGAGHTERVGTVRVGDPAGGGIPVTVDVFDASGAPRGQVPGFLFPYSHLPGGGVTLDRELPQDWRAEVRYPAP
jgi:hypothetical protein